MSTMDFSLAIVDDDAKDRKMVFEKLADVFKTRQRTVRISSFPNAESYLIALNAGDTFDLTFLDIEMPGMDGITMAKEMRTAGRKNRIVYVSNREDLVFDSLETKPFGFVRKSHFERDSDKVIDSFLETIKEEGKSVFLLVSEGRQINLSLGEIIYVESKGKKQYFHVLHQKESLPTSRTMKDIKGELEDKGFLECYKGILVNFLAIKVIGEDSIQLKNGSILPLARRKANDFRKEYMYLMQDRIQNVF